MKIVISNKSLKKALKKIGTIVPPKAVIPTLELIVVSCQNDGQQLLFKCTDLEVTMIYEIVPVQNATKDETALINFHWLKGISDLHGDEPIYIEAFKGHTIITASSGEYRQDLKVKFSEYPPLPEAPSTESVSMMPEFVKWLNAAAIICDLKAEDRTWASKVYMEILNNHLILTTTDGNYLFTHTFPITTEFTKNILLSYKVVKALDGFSETSLQIGDDTYAFKSDGMTVITKFPEGKFPVYNKIIPSTDITNCAIDRIVFKEALDKAKFINPGFVTLVPGPESVKLLAKNDHGQTANITAPLVKGYTGESFEILISSTKLQALLTQTDYEQIGLAFQAPESALILTNGTDISYIGLIMPLTIQK